MTVEERIIELGLQGLRPREIAVEVQRKPSTVTRYLSAARQRGVPIPRRRGGPASNASVIAIPAEAMARLRIYARVRGVAPARLAEELVIACATHRLVDAVLDEEQTDV